MRTQAYGFTMTVGSWKESESVGDRWIALPLGLGTGVLPGRWSVRVICGPLGVVVHVMKDDDSWDAIPPSYYLSGRWADIPTDPSRDDSDLHDTIIRAIRSLVRPLIDVPADV